MIRSGALCVAADKWLNRASPALCFEGRHDTMSMARFTRACAIAMAVSVAAAAHADDARLIVKLRSDANVSTLKARTEKLARTAGVSLHPIRAMALGADVVTLHAATSADLAAALAQLRSDPDTEYAEVDRRRHALQLAPVDDFFIAQQRYLRNDPPFISAFAAWDVTHGSPSTVVAVVDTGYRPHAGLAGRFLPGYDMIHDPYVANDGDGRDADATDPGDFVPASEAGDDCPQRASTWHGTGVAGIIAANTNDGTWTAGIDWAARILPVRVLGRCGGYDSDILDGIAWAAGLPVPGVPANPHPAQVINLSLGGDDSCRAPYVNVAAAAYAHGVTRAIVAAAGNEGRDVANDTPASCPGYIAVASTTAFGRLATYSNYGSGIAISAPGGTLSALLAGANVLVLSNAGTTTPGDDSTRNVGGTSLAAPMLSGAISLMLAVAPGLSYDAIRSILTATAKPFPADSDCTTALCGAGILDVSSAVRAAALAAPPAYANYEGLWWRAPAGSEAGWGINLAHQDDVIFATWFTYDATGKAWWLSMTANRSAPNVYAGTLYQTHGPAFNAMPFNPGAIAATAVGNGTLTFSDNDNGTFSYTVNGIQQSKPITREVFGTLPTCTFGSSTPLAQATNYQDLWWASPAASESGWGVNFTHQGDVIFATWFTYDTDGSPLWLAATANKSSPGVYTGTLYRTTGPAFSATPFDPAQIAATPVGTLTLTFTSGSAGTFAYGVNGVSQSKAITRQVFRTPGTLCQ